MPFQFQLPTQGGLEEEVAPEALLSLEVKAVHLLSLEVKAVHLLINLVKKVEQTYDLLSVRLLGIEVSRVDTLCDHFCTTDVKETGN